MGSGQFIAALLVSTHELPRSDLKAFELFNELVVVLLVVSITTAITTTTTTIQQQQQFHWKPIWIHCKDYEHNVEHVS